MPWMRPDTIAQVGRRGAQRRAACRAVHAGRRGHPVGFGKACRVELSALGADEGAKSVVAAHREAMVRIEVDDPGVLRDVDTPQDLGGVTLTQGGRYARPVWRSASRRWSACSRHHARNCAASSGREMR